MIPVRSEGDLNLRQSMKTNPLRDRVEAHVAECEFLPSIH
jgi:hypothetical protein